jgi:hypothetical protein
MIIEFCLIELTNIPLQFLQDLFNSKISLLDDNVLGVGGNNLQNTISTNIVKLALLLPQN